MFNSKLPISFFKEIAILSDEHKIYIVQHIETKKIYLKKVLDVYNLTVFKQLYKHPIKSIPRIYALYENNNQLTVIEEYISGDTLQEILDICGIFSENEVIKYAIQLCDILYSIHSLKPPIIHRDIKPSNIILTEDERIILIDMNAARQHIIEKNQDTKLIGTKGFAAPEQFGFGTSSPKTDIYALGILMITLLTNDNSPTHKINGKIGAIISRCLELDPKNRYSSTMQLKQALIKLL